MLSRIKKNKRGISVIIGYLLLITFAVIISTLVYQWLRTYVPKEALGCPDGVSVSVKEISCSDGVLNITLKNNGRFNIGGYFIHATSSPEQELATLDLSKYITSGGILQGSTIIFSAGSNLMNTDDEKTFSFNLNTTIYSVEIIPIRYQKEDNKMRTVSCGDSKIKQSIYCA